MQILSRTDSYPDLVLPDGRRADSLRWLPLLQELQRLGIPGLQPDAGKAALLHAYNAHVRKVGEEIRPEPQFGKSRPAPIGQVVMRQAARLIAENARAWMAESDMPQPTTPQRPIASTRAADA